MKNLLTIAFAVSAFGGASFAQECPFSKTQAATEVCSETAKQDCSDAKVNPAVAAFQKLDAKAKSEVVAAMTGMSSTCPMGKRMPETVKTLDRLYTASIAKLTAMTTSKAPEAFRKDAAAQLAMVKQLASFNKDTMSTMTAIMGSSCSSEAAPAGECPASGQKAVAKKESCPVSDATSLCSAWKAAPAELASMSKCATTTAKMKGYMEVLAKHKIDVMPIVAGNFQKQIAMLKAGAAKLACPKGGLMARNAEVMSACETTKSNCSSVVNYVMAANKLLASMPAMTATAECGGESCGDKDKGACCSEKSEKSAECCGTKAKTECSGAKTECSSTKAKSECSGAKSECSSAKTECSSTKAKSECSGAKTECSSTKAKSECSSTKQCPTSKQ